jgi:hypothetical protein
VNTTAPRPKRSHECERGTQECVRHNYWTATVICCEALVVVPMVNTIA